MRGVEDDIGRVARAELQAVIALEFVPLDALSVDEGPVLASLVHQEEVVFFENNEGMIARNPRIGDYQVLVHLSPHAKRSSIEYEISLLISLNEYKAWKDT